MDYISEQEDDRLSQDPEQVIREELDQAEPIPSRPQSALSWKASKYKKLYVENLEKMLVLERERRLEMQAQLEQLANN